MTAIKILAFSDLHCDVHAATEIVRLAPQVDWVIGAGDFATCRHGIEKTIDILRQIVQPTVLVPGNGESFEELQAACAGWDSVHVLHGDGVQLNGISVFGLGGAVPTTPFGSWSYDLTEAEAEQKLARCPLDAVLVSHSPPQGIVDTDSTGRHLGSVAVRATIGRTRPRLVICGHVHDSWRRQEHLDATLIVNAGPQPIFLELSRN